MSFLRYQAFRAYQKMPTSITRGLGMVAGLLPKHIILGKEFMHWQNFLNESQWWDEEKIQDYQNKQVRALIAHAYKNVPFYHREMDARGLKPKDIETTDTLCKLPIVTKPMMQQNLDDFMAKDRNSYHLDKVVTGGSSGSPMHYYWPTSAFIIERAFLWRYWRWAGYQFGEPGIRIRAKRDAKNIRHYDAIQNMIEFYPTVLDKNFVTMLAKTVMEFKPRALFAYPSYLYAIVNMLADLGLEKSFTSVKICFGFSEKVFAGQRKAVEDIIGARLFEWYGMGELIASFGQCEKNKFMHNSPEHGYVEFLRPDGTSAGVGEQAMIVGTSFLNYFWPMIRYSIGDIAETVEEKCQCGRKFQSIKEIYGRCGDFILTPSGRLISPTSLEFAVRFLKNVLEYQIVQTERDQLVIKIVPGTKYETSVGKFFAQEIINRIGESIKIVIDVVDKIERPWSQKNRFIVSKFGQEHFEKGGY